jgi:hypothetical protein
MALQRRALIVSFGTYADDQEVSVMLNEVKNLIAAQREYVVRKRKRCAFEPSEGFTMKMVAYYPSG